MRLIAADRALCNDCREYFIATTNKLVHRKKLFLNDSGTENENNSKQAKI